jgi:hypothetical protein
MTDGRDRDAAGRPRNARPRDPVTGEPLSRAAGGESVEDPPALPPEQALAVADTLLAEGRAFRAHEVLEAVWKSEADDRDLWRGLAQLAVGVTHAHRGNTAGATSLLLRAAATLAPWAGTTPHGVAVDAVCSWATETAARMERSAAPGEPGLRPPSLRTTAGAAG